LGDSGRSRTHEVFRIGESEHGDFEFEIEGQKMTVAVPSELSELGRQIIMKMILNNISTTVMARRGRAESNVMTHLNCARPDGNITNYKLLDRTVRSIQTLCEERGKPIPQYDEIAGWIALYAKRVPADESVLLKVLEHFCRD